MKSFVLGGLLLFAANVAAAGLESFDFSGNVDEERYKELISEIRCLVCQNQSLADSNAELATDLRVEIYEHMQQGKDDGEIVDFLVSRYGDFVLYSPPIKPSTYLLWYGPFALLLVGLWLLWGNIRQRSGQHEESFSAEEQERLKQLLGDKARREDGQ